IVPDQRGFQLPPAPVIDRCIPQHFAAEFTLLRSPHVLAFGQAPLRATLKHPSVAAPRGVGVSRKLRALLQEWPQGIPCDAGGRSFTLHVSPFPRSLKAKKRAALILASCTSLESSFHLDGGHGGPDGPRRRFFREEHQLPAQRQ